MLKVILEASVLFLIVSLLPETLDVLPGLKILLPLHIQLILDVFELFGDRSAVFMRR